MNTALPVLRVVPGVLLIGRGLQKLVPPSYSPPLLHAMGHRATASGFEQLGIRPGLPAALLAGSAEILGGFSLGAGLLTPVGTILIGAVMTTAILTAHARNGIWNAEGGFDEPRRTRRDRACDRRRCGPPDRDRGVGGTTRSGSAQHSRGSRIRTASDCIRGSLALRTPRTA